MDPLSVAASVLALVGAAGNTLNALQMLWDLRHAPDEVFSLINEVGPLP